MNIPFQNKLMRRPFSKYSQHILNLFVFFIAFPAIDLFGNSITFYLFIFAVLRIGAFLDKPFKGKVLLLIFLVLAILSMISTPYMPRNPGFFQNTKTLIQYTYWISIYLFLISQYDRIDLFALSKWVFWGTITSTICFYFFSLKFYTPIIEFHTGNSRNSFVFNMLCAIPISFYYVTIKWGKKIFFLAMPFFLVVMFYTDGRSAAIIIIIQLVIIASIIFSSFNRMARFLVPVFALLYLLSQSESTQIYLNGLADEIESANPRFASLLRGEQQGDLSFDKSWLTRKLMVDKGIEIFKAYPLRGIGLENFNYYDGKMATLSQYERLGAGDAEYFNTRSAHNSYVQLLAETGILGISLFIIILAVPTIFFFKRFFENALNVNYLPLVGLFGAAIHLYAIAALTVAILWMLIGLSWGILNSEKK